MEKIVIDANIVIAVFDRQDSTHKQAVLLLERFKESGSMLIMLNLVIYEILTVLHMKGYRKEAHGFYRLVHSDPRMRIVYLNADLESRAYYNFLHLKT
jgi:predicted nucleic acid-binding protein